MAKVKKVLAVASEGGHWVELLRMKPLFDQYNTVYMSTNPALQQYVAGNRLVVVRDASMWNKLALMIMALQVLWQIIRIRPDVVISTGAAPGFFAIMFGRLLGAKTIWLDSIANAHELSLAGKKASTWATHWLTQWPELAQKDGPHYIGSII